MASDTVTVKEEPVWEQVTGSHRVSEAAVLAGLYTDHEVKEELVIGPEVLQPPDAVFTAENRENSERSRGRGHQDHTYAKTESPNAEVHVKEEVVECLKEEAEWEALAVREQPVLRDCAVRLERIDSLEALLEGTTRVEHNPDVGNRIHTTTNIATEKEAYVCDICKKRFDLKTQLKKHVMTHLHRRTEQEESMRGVARNAPAGGGRGEGREPTRARGYRYSCEICKKKFSTPSMLKRHERIHTGERPFACRICKKKFPEPSKLKRHERVHTGERPFACGICQQKFAHSCHLKTHERTHTGEKPFSCRICQQMFARSSHLKAHERTHTGVKPFACGVCNKKFTVLGNLKTHERIHTGERPFSCGICKQKFALSSTLKTHERTHTGEKPFACEICQQKFTDLSSLNRHKRIHTGERRFSCGICQQKFARSSTLKEHERTHTGVKPFSCGICKQKFARSSTLKEHERTHTGAKPFSCEICQQKFAQSSTLKKHERTHESTTIHMHRV